MRANHPSVGIQLPMQTSTAISTANAIHDALARFYVQPTPSNQTAAVDALQAYLSEIERAASDGIDNDPENGAVKPGLD